MPSQILAEILQNLSTSTPGTGPSGRRGHVGGDASSTVSITIHPALPTRDAGAILQNLSGGVVQHRERETITGTPSVNQTATTYTIYANNSGGDASTEHHTVSSLPDQRTDPAE